MAVAGVEGCSTRAASRLLKEAARHTSDELTVLYARHTSDELTVLYSNGPDDRSVKLALGYVTAATCGC